MSVGLDQYLDSIRQANNGVLPLNGEQLSAISHDFGAPLWIVAGPGTGKTHTLVWLALKRMIVDGVPPSKVILTTFTRKAAAELSSRLVLAHQSLIKVGLSEAGDVDVTQVRLGTLHSLCSRILQDERYDPTLRIRVLEGELSQEFFIRRTKNPLLDNDDADFWATFGIRGIGTFPPSKAGRASGAAQLFNKMTETSADIPKMIEGGDELKELAEAYLHYQSKLIDQHRTDQANLQRHFLEFLRSPQGQHWIGDGITLVVDEYQDTNPIQEQIYFEIARKNGDLTVVGDDDQSIYRFRGATVESLVEFDNACVHYLGLMPKPVYLFENRRSHEGIVEWVNRFIEHHPKMKDKTVRVRAPGKPSLVAKSSIPATYPPVMVIERRTNPLTGAAVAEAIRELLDSSLVEDPSQIAILSMSTRESTQGISAFTDALTGQGIPHFNPRHGRVQRDLAFRQLLGGMSVVLDVDFDPATSFQYGFPRGVLDYVDAVRGEFLTLLSNPDFSGLAKYVEASHKAVRNSKKPSPDNGQSWWLKRDSQSVTYMQILYKLIAFEPFATMLSDSVSGERLKALNIVLAEYESHFNDGQLLLEEGPDGNPRVNRTTLYNFYAILVEGIHDRLDDPEDDEVSIQPGAVNVMTIHQSKGLEFEIVFVVRPEKQPGDWGNTYLLEDLLDPFSLRPFKPSNGRRSPQHRGDEDAIRLFYVAYSRAKRLLILAGTDVEKWQRVLGNKKDGYPIMDMSDLNEVGVVTL